MDRARLNRASSVGAGREQLHAEFERIGFRRRRQFVDERFGGERRLRTIGIAQVSGAKRRLPNQRQAHHLTGHPAMGDRVHFRRRGRAARGGTWRAASP